MIGAAKEPRGCVVSIFSARDDRLQFVSRATTLYGLNSINVTDVFPAGLCRVYLDHAATSFPKPPTVIDAVRRAMTELGAPAGRGAYAEAILVEREIAATRRAVAELLDFDNADRVIFTAGGTDSLHLGLGGILRAGDHVVTTEAEHNSVLRPLMVLRTSLGITVRIVPCDGAGRIDVEPFAEALQEQPTRLAVFTHASNVTGVVQPAAELAALARRHGALTLLDACQTAGHIPVSMRELDVDLLATSGHKGLLGPLGTGLLLVGARAAETMRPVRIGGTGSRSDELTQPETFPDRLEAGNLNVPGILGLGAGIEYLRSMGITMLAERADKQMERLAAAARTLPGVRVLPPWDRESDHDASPRVGLMSLTITNCDPREAAAMLDASFRVQVRAGLHCAPLVHRRLGTDQTGGTLRFSVGPFTTEDDIAVAIEALTALADALG